MDIRTKTGIIIRKDGKYLVGFVLYSKELRWSDSPYDAWRTRSPEKAGKVARKVGRATMLFNPIVGQLRNY